MDKKSWVKRHCKFVGAMVFEVVEYNGKPYVSVGGSGTFQAKNQLKSAGFRWNEKDKVWVRDYASLMSDPLAKDILKSFGLQVDNLMGAKEPAGPKLNQAPKLEQPQQQQQRSTGLGRWLLAETLTPIGDYQGLVTLRKRDSENWDYLTRDGRTGQISNAEVASNVRSLKDENGKTLQGMDPEQLFTGQEAVEDSGTEKKEAQVVNRIPKERITKHQKAIEKTFVETDQNVMMNALAGTGKTTMLRHLSTFKNPNEKWLYLVFNKKNKVEASGPVTDPKTGKPMVDPETGKEITKFAQGVEVFTSHAFLGKVLNSSAERQSIIGTNIWTEGGERIGKMIDDDFKFDDSFPKSVKYPAKKVVKKLVSLSKSYAIRPNDPEAPSKIADIIKKYQIDMDLSTDRNAVYVDYTSKLINKTVEVLVSSLPENGQGEYKGSRDHDDTLWYAATMDGVAWPKYDVVLADEVQDFNKCQSIMLQKLSDQGARIVAVGDPNQAIYMFRGGDSDAFKNVQDIVTKDDRGVSHALPQNFRNGKKIIQFVRDNTSVKDIESGCDFDGEVTEDREYDEVMGSISQEWTKNGGKLKDQTAFIARTNRPLVDAALELLKGNIDFQIIGRDFSTELTDVIDRITGKGKDEKRFNITNFPSEIDSYIADLQSKWVGKISKAAELSELQDISESLKSVVNFLSTTDFYDKKLRFKVKDTRDFKEYITKKFDGVNTDTPEGSSKYERKDPKSFVTLTTAHRAKGLEFNRVFIMGTEMFPHPKAKTPEEMVQEDNAWYVALTRAIYELHVLAPTPSDRKAMHWVITNCKFANSKL
jgi:superfamily I DNA/RNA helicase